MATMILASHKETRPKKGNVVGRFMQSYVLGLIPRLTDVINDTVSTHPPVVEQRRCIRALEEMIKVCKSYAGVARPQVSCSSDQPEHCFSHQLDICMSAFVNLSRCVT